MNRIRPSRAERAAQEVVNHQKYAAAKPANAAGSITFLPVGNYTGNNMGSSRDGANERTHASLQMRAQIEVRTA